VLTILNAEAAGYNPQAVALLECVGCYRALDGGRDALLGALRDTDILIVRLSHSVDAALMDHAPRLRIIASATTGLNHIDLAEATRRGIQVLSLKGEGDFLSRITATAEMTWALLLALLRRLPAAAAHTRDGQWDRDLFIGRELRGKTLGVIGYGRLGRIVAGYGTAFRMRVLACDRQPFAAPDGVQAVSLAELLSASDIISLHANHEPANVRMIGADAFAAMQSTAVFVNTARGELVDEDALLAALRDGRLAGAALDVLEGERGADGAWLRGRPLHAYAQAHDNLLLTPHIGGACVDSMHETELFMAGKIVAAAKKLETGLAG
jgi:D-3-phosphoglycerate dehydrogenase